MYFAANPKKQQARLSHSETKTAKQAAKQTKRDAKHAYLTTSAGSTDQVTLAQILAQIQANQASQAMAPQYGGGGYAPDMPPAYDQGGPSINQLPVEDESGLPPGLLQEIEAELDQSSHGLDNELAFQIDPFYAYPGDDLPNPLGQPLLDEPTKIVGVGLLVFAVYMLAKGVKH